MITIRSEFWSREEMTEVERTRYWRKRGQERERLGIVCNGLNCPDKGSDGEARCSDLQ